MKQYRTVNNLMGWLTFIIAATVYCLTIEPTASFISTIVVYSLKTNYEVAKIVICKDNEEESKKY